MNYFWRIFDSVLVKDKLYGEPEEIFVKKFTTFVNEIREMPMTDIAGEINKFKKNCEVQNKMTFELQKKLYTHYHIYELYEPVKRFWRKDNK
jgi:hypothetical protein